MITANGPILSQYSIQSTSELQHLWNQFVKLINVFVCYCLKILETQKDIKYHQQPCCVLLLCAAIVCWCNSSDSAQYAVDQTFHQLSPMFTYKVQTDFNNTSIKCETQQSFDFSIKLQFCDN